MPEQKRTFGTSKDNRGLACQFQPILCQEGYCKGCQIYLDWRKLEIIIELCAWCGDVIRRKPGLGQSGVSHGICPECEEKHFPEFYESGQQQIEGGVGGGAKETTRKGG